MPMNSSTTLPSRELPFRTWLRLASELAAARPAWDANPADWTKVRELLAPHADGVVYVRRKGSELWTGFAMLWAGEARAYAAYLECPWKFSGAEPMPALSTSVAVSAAMIV